jgi:hypothetical protein
VWSFLRVGICRVPYSCIVIFQYPVAPRYWYSVIRNVCIVARYCFRLGVREKSISVDNLRLRKYVRNTRSVDSDIRLAREHGSVTTRCAKKLSSSSSLR